MSYKTKPLPAGTPEKVERVGILMRLMSSGGYYGRNTCLELADKWGIHWTTVRDDAAEAGRFLKLEPGEIEQRRAELSAWAASVAKQALETKSNVTGLPDYKAALEAQRMVAGWQGIADKPVDTGGAGTSREPIKIEIVTLAKPEPEKDPEGT